MKSLTICRVNRAACVHTENRRTVDALTRHYRATNRPVRIGTRVFSEAGLFVHGPVVVVRRANVSSLPFCSAA